MNPLTEFEDAVDAMRLSDADKAAIKALGETLHDGLVTRIGAHFRKHLAATAADGAVRQEARDAATDALAKYDADPTPVGLTRAIEE